MYILCHSTVGLSCSSPFPALSYLCLHNPTSFSTAILHWSLPRPTSAYHIKPQPTLSHLPTPSYIEAYCHPTSHKTQSYSILPHLTTSYIVLHYILLTSYPVLPYPTTSNPHPTSSYTTVSCQPTLSFLILLHPTASNPTLHCFLLPA